MTPLEFDTFKEWYFRSMKCLFQDTVIVWYVYIKIGFNHNTFKAWCCLSTQTFFKVSGSFQCEIQCYQRFLMLDGPRFNALFSSSLALRTNKLECLTSLMFASMTGAYLSGASEGLKQFFPVHTLRLVRLILTTNIRNSWNCRKL
jgi:hypothetical protein